MYLKLHEVIKMPITHTQLTIFFSVLIVIIIFFCQVFIKQKKRRIIVILCVILTFICFDMALARFDNPPIQAMMSENRIIFKKDEIIRFNDIKSIKYFEDVELNLSAYGYRWDDGIYYSGDAAFNITDDDTTLLSVPKCRAYITYVVKNYIYVYTDKANEKFIFNLETEEATKQFYDKIRSSINQID